jgi:hypothetical protein
MIRSANTRRHGTALVGSGDLSSKSGALAPARRNLQVSRVRSTETILEAMLDGGAP